MSTQWIDKAFSALPGTDDALFKNVWKNRWLLFDGKQGIGDTFDFYSACLIASAHRCRERLLVVLPDFSPHRPAFLLTTALLRHVLDAHHDDSKATWPRGPVLYFGSQIGIREQLRRTSIQGLGLDLAHVFSQQDVRRGAVGADGHGPSQGSAAASLPRVITVYSPADPVGILQAYQPCWIAIDCSDATSMTWLEPLLKEAIRQGVAVVAWGQNALSDWIDDFSEFGHTFIWPPRSPLLQSKESISVQPVVLCGTAIDHFSASLSKGRQSLISATQRSGGRTRFGRDAVSVHWRHFRSLESLSVPFDFYEAEATRFWGLRPLRTLASVCSHFRAACTQADAQLRSDLEEIGTLLQEAQHDLENLGCGLWEGLVNLSIEDRPGNEVRILVFPSESRKQLFLYGLLARHNTTEDDLHKIRTHVTSLNGLGNWVRSNQSVSGGGAEDSLSALPADAVWHPTLVGLPSQSMAPRLLYALLHPKLEIVLYPHQRSSFMRRQAEWSVRLGGDTVRNVETLSKISNVALPQPLPPPHGRISVEKPVEMSIDSNRKTTTTLAGAVWHPEDPVIEVARLFRSAEEDEAEDSILTDRPDGDISVGGEPEEGLWCAQAVRVQFDQGWHAYFAFNDTINVITNGSLDLRHVRSLRPEERVLIIHGQRRQDLYELIISRVHRHPSIELHLAVIRRWQKDLRAAFAQWRLHPVEPKEVAAYGHRDLEGLLRRMQARGSVRESSLTLSHWINGFVLCPLDPQDLRRVAEILDMRFVQQNYKLISQAASRLRGLHRGLSNRLNRWLQEQVTGGTQGGDDDIIDAELGLTFGDVRTSLLVLRVKNVETVTGPFLRSTLGRVEKET